MKKTSVYLTESQVERLRTLAAEEGRSEASVIRDAIATYHAPPQRRSFAISGAWEGDGTSVADVPDDALLDGFGS